MAMAASGTKALQSRLKEQALSLSQQARDPHAVTEALLATPYDDHGSPRLVPVVRAGRNRAAAVAPAPAPALAPAPAATAAAATGKPQVKLTQAQPRTPAEARRQTYDTFATCLTSIHQTLRKLKHVEREAKVPSALRNMAMATQRHQIARDTVVQSNAALKGTYNRPQRSVVQPAVRTPLQPTPPTYTPRPRRRPPTAARLAITGFRGSSTPGPPRRHRTIKQPVHALATPRRMRAVSASPTPVVAFHEQHGLWWSSGDKGPETRGTARRTLDMARLVSPLPASSGVVGVPVRAPPRVGSATPRHMGTGAQATATLPKAKSWHVAARASTTPKATRSPQLLSPPKHVDLIPDEYVVSPTHVDDTSRHVIVPILRLSTRTSS